MEYLFFWPIYIFTWCNLCKVWVISGNLKTAHSKMAFWDSLKKHWHLCYFQLFCVKYGCNSHFTLTLPFIPNFNRINNLSNEENHYLERKYPSFELLDIFNFFVTSFIFTLLLFTIFLHLCNSMSYKSFFVMHFLSRDDDNPRRVN